MIKTFETKEKEKKEKKANEEEPKHEKGKAGSQKKDQIAELERQRDEGVSPTKPKAG